MSFGRLTDNGIFKDDKGVSLEDTRIIFTDKEFDTTIKILVEAIIESNKSLLEALELIDETIEKGFANVEEQLENIGDALRDLKPEE